MMNGLLLSALIVSASPLAATPNYFNLTDNNYSSVSEDLKKLNINQNYNHDSFITLTRDEKYTYIYFYVSSINIRYFDLYAYISIVDEKDEEEFYKDDVFHKYNFSIVSNENNYYKAVTSSSSLLKTTRINIDYLANKQALHLEAKQTYLYSDKKENNKVILEKQLEITSGVSKYTNLKYEDWYYGIPFKKNAFLYYYFFNTEIDNRLSDINDRITDVTIEYEYFSWNIKVGWLVYETNGLNYFLNQDYDFYKNNPLVTYSQGENLKQIKSLNENDKRTFVKHNWFGKKTFSYYCLFKTSDSDMDFVKENKGNHKWGCMFEDCMNVEGLIDPLHPDNNPFRDHYIYGTHIEKVHLLDISYVDDGVFYENVAVYDTWKQTERAEDIDDKDNDEETTEGDWLSDLIKSIIKFFKDVYNFFKDNPYALYIFIGVIIFLFCMPLIIILVDFFKTIFK